MKRDNTPLFQTGDLVEVNMHEKLGWGDKRESYLVLVLRRHNAKQQQIYPLTASWEEFRASKKCYIVMTSCGMLRKVKLGTWHNRGVSCTSDLVQSLCERSE